MKRWANFGLVLVVALATGCASSTERKHKQERKARMIETNIQLSAGYLQRGQLDFAKEKLDKALEIDAGNVQANNMMALLQWRLGDNEQAERYFRKAVTAEPGDPEAFNNYGVFLCRRGRIDKAEPWFKKALADPLYRTPAQAAVNAGVCLMQKPAPTVAEDYFRTALKIDPKLPVALYQMAKISYDSGHTLVARGFVQRYFEAAEDTPESLLLATRIERALRNKNEAASYALRLRGKFPDAPETKQLQSDAAGRRGY